MSKVSYDYYRILGKINVDQNKWNEYGGDIYMNVILDSINNILEESGFDRLTLSKMIYYNEKDLKSKILALFKEIIKITKAWDIYPLLVWENNIPSIEIRQKVERLNLNPNESNKIFKILKSLMEGNRND